MIKDMMKTSFGYRVDAPEGIIGGLPRPYVFLAGGIQNCPEWQTEVLSKLSEIADSMNRPFRRFTVFNPRRANFPIHDPSAAEEQISWEFNALALSNIVSFWFSRGSDNPIVMFEYGKYLERFKQTGHPALIVGCDPEYKRKQDVLIQTRLVRTSEWGMLSDLNQIASRIFWLAADDNW